MRTQRTSLFILLAFLVNCLWAQGSPLPMLNNVSQQILNTLKANQGQLKNNPQLIYKTVEQNLLPHVDVEGMSRSVLGRQAWMKANASERQQFSRAFTQLVMRTYASPLAEYKDETIKFLPIRGNLNGRFLRVNSLIVRSSGPDIPVSYSLVSKNGDWKIYDMSVEGVSLLQSFRNQFAQVLQNSSMQNLIHEMQKQSAKRAG